MFEDASGYERFMGRWSALLAPAFLDVVDLGAPSAVLDVGCGTGNLALAVADRWPSATVTGVDRSPGFIAAAADRFDLVSVATAKKGVSLDLRYRVRLRPGCSPASLVAELNAIEGVDGVELNRPD